MQMIILILSIGFIFWLLSLGFAEKLGNFFIKNVINPIKELFI